LEEHDHPPLDRHSLSLRRVGEFPFPTRALNAFERMGVRYIGDLVELTPDQLLQIRHFGLKSLNEVECVLV